MTHTYNLPPAEFDLLISHYIHSLLIARDVKCDGSMSVNDFRNRNERVLTDAAQECFSELAHAPTYEQINEAIHIYFKSRR